MFMLIAALALIAFVSSVVYLLEFAQASRRDRLFLPAAGGGARRARRISGVYVRDRFEPGGDGQGRPVPGIVLLGNEVDDEFDGGREPARR